jgi:hypothetical protein
MIFVSKTPCYSKLSNGQRYSVVVILRLEFYV